MIKFIIFISILFLITGIYFTFVGYSGHNFLLIGIGGAFMGGSISNLFNIHSRTHKRN